MSDRPAPSDEPGDNVLDLTPKLPRHRDDPRPEPIGVHVPVCSHCGERWPCRAAERHRLEKRRREWAALACGHCGKPTNGCMRVKVNGRWFHARKGAACFTAARRAARAAGIEEPTIEDRTW